MRVVLVTIHTGPSPQAVPLAAAFLQSRLKKFPESGQCQVERVDFFLGQDPATCAGTLTELKPDLVGFSMYVWNRDLCREIAEEVRCSVPGVTVFAGGPEATADPAGVLAGAAFDFLIAGEGETPFAQVCLRLLQKGDISTIPGVATRTSNGIMQAPSPPLTNLDEIPSPWLNGTINARNYSGILWQLSRGCGFACDFCFDSRDRHGVRRFSLERIEAELRHFATSGVNQIFILDSTFNQDLPRAKTILRLIRKLAPQIHFHFEVRSEFIDRELAELFASITCSLQIGLQSADVHVLKQVGRSFRPDDFASRTMLLNDSGAVFGFDLMYGLPGDTLAGFRRSLDFALGLYPNHLDIFPLAILPGTALALRADSIGLNYQKQPPYTLVSSATFSDTDMDLARKLASACDIFYTRGRAVAWFNGLCAALRQRPSELLQKFSDWLDTAGAIIADEASFSDEQVWQLQRKFTESCMSGKKQSRLLQASLDLVDYHYHYAAALLTPPTKPVKRISGNRLLASTSLRLASTARLAEFHYEILEILEGGAADVRCICDTLRPCRSWAVIYPSSAGICTESIDQGYFELLKELNGTGTAGEIAAHLGFTPAETAEFLEFALSQGIVQP